MHGPIGTLLEIYTHVPDIQPIIRLQVQNAGACDKFVRPAEDRLGAMAKSTRGLTEESYGFSRKACKGNKYWLIVLQIDLERKRVLRAVISTEVQKTVRHGTSSYKYWQW